MKHSVPELGFSVTNLEEFPLYQSVMDRLGWRGSLPFVEILWDNYVHLDPWKLKDFLASFSARVSFHIMWSRFLERDDEAFEVFLAQLSQHVRVVQPICVSDHLCRFTSANKRLIVPLEWRYGDLSQPTERIKRYQEAIRVPLLLENYASTEPHGIGQIAFLEELRIRTDCDLLFDISNARAADLNGVTPFDRWLEYLRGRTIRCHIGSFSFNAKTQLFHDTHNRDFDETLRADVRALVENSHIESLCYERDYDKNVEAMAKDLSEIALTLGYDSE